MSSTTLRPLVPAVASPSVSHLTTGASPAAGRRSASSSVRAVRNYDSIPKREPFSSSRSILDEFLRQEKPLVQRTKDQITALFSDFVIFLINLYFTMALQELPKEEIARMVKDSEGDVKYLIDSIHHRSNLRKKMAEKARHTVSSSSQGQKAKPRPFPVPDGLPKTQEELAEEEEALMPESPYTRLLRRMGRYPDWYTPRPDHETD
ncbi:hypothetical protein C2845_PM02G46810 [Panicum miliaceum]|uniref:Uncharacterized protein n=1 Tax=Panicum miliaceum TaxID=4540 RepID=A0A3L6S9F2_PANMI|nr:hypothetical protein C2845_PM02G46810 [Panicum miliaceum]